jgi:acyl-CoA synthetase (AMP-forming)/AMP-acid ligase II
VSLRADLDQLAAGVLTPVTGDRPARPIVSCGPPTDACQIRVVDPESRRLLADGHLGEIWLRGPSISTGYWNRDDSGTFGAVTADGDGGYLRTGDLGVFHDGELYVHGRLKEMIISNGRNVYPQDIEHELRAQHPELGKAGAVFGVPADVATGGGESVVVVHEVPGMPEERLRALAGRIRRTVGREFGVGVGTVALLRPGTVLRTTSGKVRRAAMRDLFRDGGLTVLYQEP